MSRTAQRDLEFRDFFVAEGERLRRLGLFLTGDPDRAADLAQETMARMYRHWGRVKEADPGPYARRTLVNLVRSQHRRSILERRHERPAPDRATGHADRVEDWMRMATALKTLSPIRRATIVLRFYEDMSEAEIARALDRPLGTVKSDIHRGLARLRPLLADERPMAEPSSRGPV